MSSRDLQANGSHEKEKIFRFLQNMKRITTPTRFKGIDEMNNELLHKFILIRTLKRSKDHIEMNPSVCEVILGMIW